VLFAFIISASLRDVHLVHAKALRNLAKNTKIFFLKIYIQISLRSSAVKFIQDAYENTKCNPVTTPGEQSLRGLAKSYRDVNTQVPKIHFHP
jgi:hypothetical protein